MHKFGAFFHSKKASMDKFNAFFHTKNKRRWINSALFCTRKKASMDKFGTFFHAKKGVNEKAALFLTAKMCWWKKIGAFFLRVKRRRLKNAAAWAMCGHLRVGVPIWVITGLLYTVKNLSKNLRLLKLRVLPPNSARLRKSARFLERGISLPNLLWNQC